MSVHRASIVMKFGGSSVESAAAIRRVASIVSANVAQRPVVVVSAMGKTTNALLAIAAAAAEGRAADAERLIDALRAYHAAEAGELIPAAHRDALNQLLAEHFAELVGV